MTFTVGQQYESASHARCIAQVVAVGGEGASASVEIRAEDGTLINSGWVAYEQFAAHWSLMAHAAIQSAA